MSITFLKLVGIALATTVLKKPTMADAQVGLNYAR